MVVHFDQSGNSGGAAFGGRVGWLVVHKGGRSTGARRGGDSWGRPWPEAAGASDSSAVDITDTGLWAVLGDRW
jgi:hypothetical protein